MDPRRARALLATGLSASLLAVSVLVSSAAPPHKGGGRCNPRKSDCTTTSTTASPTPTTSPTTTSTSTTAPADTTPPSTRIASPTDGTAVASSLDVEGSSTDDRQVARVELRVDGGSWTAAAGTSSWSMSVDTASWAPGSAHTIGARAIDAAGNASAVTGVTVQKAAAPPPPPVTSDPSVAPATQGTWTSPEGATISVDTAGPWTIRDIYRMLLENASAPGDFSRIAPTLKVNVQDTYGSQMTSTARTSDGVYIRFSATVWLKGVSSGFSAQPDATLSHEYGHVWTQYHLFMSNAGDWSSYLGERWTTSDGSVRLSEDSRLNTSYGWDGAEIIGDDYRLLFGSPAAISQRPAHMNIDIPAPTAVPGLRDMLLQRWAR